MPKVATGMPVWNGEKFVSEAIESILAQTYGDFELVISDNASTDATAEICHDYAKQDARIRYIRQKTNIGAAPNYNEVFRHSSGQYFKWAAHDDVLAPEFIGECVRCWTKTRR
jgi:glycosyltransferase involved in cell wall biosynthesis